VCLCQHHGAAYCERTPTGSVFTPQAQRSAYDDGATITSCQIITTKQCCIAVNAATITTLDAPATDFEIERPVGTIRTTQEDYVESAQLRLQHHAAWEVLNPGTYTYYLVNRAGHATNLYAAWLKIIASDCEG